MENAYSITVTNKFCLALDEDQDPLEILKLREQEQEKKKKDKLNEKENKTKQPNEKPASAASSQQQLNKQPQQSNKQSKINKENQQQLPRNQDAKKDQAGDKKPSQQKFGGERNVKFNTESREEHYNRRNHEDGERPRIQNDFRRGPSGEGREPREYRELRGEFRNHQDFGERRGGGRGRGLGRGRGGGFRGRGGFDNRGKREFDRQSGSDKTGIKPIDKKDGAGSHNWGTHNDEIEESLNQSDQDWAIEKLDESPTTVNETKDSAGTGGTSAEVGDSGDKSSGEEKPAEEEARELTLDEWKALRQNRPKPEYNLRKAGEGEDPSRWKKMYALERKKEGEAEEDEDDEEYDAAEYPQRVGRQKHVLDIEIQFSDSRRSGGGGRGRVGRGGRAPGRGFGNRGPPRGGFESGEPRSTEQRSPRERQNAPKVDDEHDFPSLG
ncbi:SERPINE1 mRNA-binding protein 1-like isoform X2 [Phymastichus coffea]|uniref:SERPINE1 mRNA-binding protein 1-like isoform X2 n=1 Tax=Phymastichus coffea TaxID=108790 RepID=UPI00273B243A|nr:SERPINE1 mRNA-binding protein 1-like isoform X2 [Phymastichus coffea]